MGNILKTPHQIIKMSDLEEGDIFCFELKLSGREAFQFYCVEKEKYLVVKSRKHLCEKRIQFDANKNIIFLRHEKIQ